MQEQPAFDKKQFVAWVKKYIKNITEKLEPESAEVFKKNIEPATKFLLSKLSDLQLYVLCLISILLILVLKVAFHFHVPMQPSYSPSKLHVIAI